MSFIVNHDGTFSESDVGLDTAKIASAVTKYNPTDGWPPVSE